MGDDTELMKDKILNEMRLNKHLALTTYVNNILSREDFKRIDDYGSSGILYNCNGFKESCSPVLLGKKAGLLWLSLNFTDVFYFILFFLKISFGCPLCAF